jgi:hypothetical protein
MSSLNTSPRCAHIKVNGAKCGSPALKPDTFCFFHARWREEHVNLNQKSSAPAGIDLPILEDAYSIQMVLSQVMRLLLTGEIDKKSAGLLLYALQTASYNLGQMARQLKTQREEESHRAFPNGLIDAFFGLEPGELEQLADDFEAGKKIEPLVTYDEPRKTPKSQPQNGKPIGDIKAQAAPRKLPMNRRIRPKRALNRSCYPSVQSTCDSILTRKPASGLATHSSTG